MIVMKTTGVFVKVASIAWKPRKVFVFAYFAHMRDRGALAVESSKGLHKERRPREFKAEMGREAVGSARAGDGASPPDLQSK